MDSLSAIQAPAIWKTAWLLPFSTTMIIFLLTGNIRDGSFNQAHLIARILLLVCMFLISHTQILLLHKFFGSGRSRHKIRNDGKASKDPVGPVQSSHRQNSG